MSLATSALAPGPALRYPLANWLALRRNPLEFLSGLARDHGDVVRFSLGPVFVHLVNEPDRFSRTDGARVTPAAMITLRPRGGLPMRIDPRRL
jgi:hypothetical protein